MQYTKIFADFCPETGRQMHIQVYAHKIYLGVSSSSKALEFDCTHRSEYGCDICGPEGRECPVYLKAKAAIER